MDKDKQERKGKRMKLVFLGPPGSGKGTYASRIAPKLGIPHVAVGDIFRKAIADGTPMGRKAKVFYDQGKPVPDSIATGIIIERLSEQDCEGGFILDSPYNAEQAEEIDKSIGIDTVINIVISENAIVQRLSTRRVCKKCGAIYNVKTVKPKVEGVCDKCGGELYQRKDDMPEAIRERLRVYEERSVPLLKYYKKKGTIVDIVTKDPDLPPEVTVEKIMKEIGKK